MMQQKIMSSQNWAITPQEAQVYEKIFKTFDANQSGNVTAGEMQKIIQQTQCPREICAKVWQMTNPMNAPVFSKAQFFVVMQLLSRAKKGDLIPDVIPPELIQTSGLNQQQPQQVPQQMNVPPQQELQMPPVRESSLSNAVVVAEPPKPEFPKPEFANAQKPKDDPLASINMFGDAQQNSNPSAPKEEDPFASMLPPSMSAPKPLELMPA